VTLDIDMPAGRLEDIMRLAVKPPQPPMTGGLHLTGGSRTRRCSR
jgi:hypothetical protein